ncbi:uncharacterized protein LOC141646811 [Silene latifolia]|uniref:uncharacterized protein LOC141646811 n=1 Tax=Silene latifolia TaxID=37657 RepID=UPI003D77F76D
MVLVIEQFGPIGRQEPPKWNFILEKGDKITKVQVESGYVVDSLSFEILEPSGNVKTIWPDGTVSGKIKFVDAKTSANEANTIDLVGERITQISGLEGDLYNSQHAVQLLIHTDFTPEGYGPFGDKTDTTNLKGFKSPATSTEPIVGFFGVTSTYRGGSIGVYISKDTSKMLS